jgi:hypothetical protein
LSITISSSKALGSGTIGSAGFLSA